ncbi:MAG: energy-coupling factor transporter transmembrane protein EcfT [Gemmatimonadetes bacterium]|nr:energy-coupling factor transporter transmembrane protein EcfT [Gemmatimonadota bacterium]
MSGGLAGRAHPFTAGSVSLAMVLLAVLVPAPNGPPLLYAAVCLVALLTGVGRAVRHGMLLAAPLWVLLFLMHGVLGEGPRIAAPWGGTLSATGMAWAVEQGSRLAAIVTASLAFARAFDPHRFLQAAIARRWPFSVAFLVVATLDAMGRFGEQATRLREAQRTRGLKVRGSIATRARAIPALVFPLLLASLTEADEQALALETRGLTAPGRRTALDPPADGALDRLVRWSALAVVLVTLWWRVMR